MQRRTPLAVRRLAAALLLLLPGLSFAQGNLVPEDDLSGQLKVIDVTFDRRSVSGRLVNRTPNTLRDIRLEIRLTWYWTNETSPGEDSPGRTGFYDVPGEIGPDGEMRFVYRIDPPLPERTDGRFAAFVSVAGLTEVIAE